MATKLPIPRVEHTASDEEVMELETADLPTADDDIIELEDGSVIVQDKTKQRKESSEHDDNLAETLDPTWLSTLGIDLVDKIEQDIENRKERDKQYAEGQKRTGLSGQDKKGADFDGSSTVTHPMLAKGCVDFASKAIKELYPAGGPVKTQIIGKQTDEKLTRAERKRQFMNWQMTTRVAENRTEFERLLSQLPLGGAGYKRWWWDARQKRPRTEAVFIDDVFIPYNCADFRTAYRATHRQYISKAEFDKRVADGLYIDLPSLGQAPGDIENKSESREAAEAVEGVSDDNLAYNDEGVREIFMCFADIDAEDNGEVGPYILHLDKWSKKVLGVYRNWAAEDEQREKLDWMVEYIFIPWRGPQGIGLNHLIGSMAVSATGALRALLDSAHINNFPGGLKLKAGRTAGQSITVNATELAEIDCPAGIDDIRKLVMPFPFNGPSTVLYTLLEWLTQQAEQVVATANEKIADGGSDMPVGTALALIEQGSVNFSAIHARLHASLKQELAIVHRLNAINLSDQETVEDLGELVVHREDFTGPVDIIPVSDPNIFSETQRFAQLQVVMQLATPGGPFAQFFRPDKLLRRALKMLNVSDADDIAMLPPEPNMIDAVEENYVVCLDEPRPLKVYEIQDDYEHLLSHTHFMSSPMFGGNALIAPQALPALLKHCKEHLMALYKKHNLAAAEVLKQMARMQGVQLDDAKAQSRGSAFADRMLAGMLGPQIMPALMGAMKMAKDMMPPPAATPDKMAEIASKERLAGAQLAYDRERDDKDRDANREASFLAQGTHHADMQHEQAMAGFQHQANQQMEVLKNQLARLDREIEHNKALEQNDATHEQAVLLQMLKDQGMQQLEALKFIFTTTSQLAAPQQTKNADGTTSTTPGKPVPGLPPAGGIVAALLQGLQANNELVARALGEQAQTLQALTNGMQELQELQAAPRTAEFMFDESGRKTGIKSEVKRPARKVKK